MKLNKMLMIAAVSIFAASAAQSQERDWSMKDRFVYDRDNKELYAPELTLDLAGAYGVGRAKFDDSLDRSWRRDHRSGRSGRFGASIGVNSFFTKHFGIGVDAFGLDNDGGLVDAASGSVILRLPIDVAHLAPYVFGGGGRIFEGPDTWTGHVGAGLELRLNPRTGIFVDGRHIFAKRSSVSDLGLARAGLRFAF